MCQKRHWCCTLYLRCRSTNFNYFWQRCCWESRPYAIKRWFVITSFLSNVSVLPGEAWTPEIVSFQSCCIPCLENDTALAWYIFDTHQPILIILWTIRSHYQVQCANIISRLAISFSRHSIQHDWKDTISGLHVHVSPGSAETLVRTGGIRNHHLIPHSLSNIWQQFSKIG